MDLYHYTPGTIPLIVSIPHTGTYVPPAILERFTAPAKQLPDTDWHVERLYDFAKELGAHVIAATHSRYVIDLNRAPDNTSLYPGKFTTGLCPATLFDGSPLYLEGKEPGEAEVRERLETYWQPYHRELLMTLIALRTRHKKVVVFDAHSICSQMPTLFDGQLPDLNLGTADSKSCDPQLAEELFAICKGGSYSAVHNGRFKGGYITRHYGRPAENFHAIQLELAQHNYMLETHPFTYDEAKAGNLQAVLRSCLEHVAQWISK